jgi:hypothetical protein
MKKWLIGILIIFLLAFAMYSAVYFWIIPVSAKMMIPFKWNRIPLNQKREVVTGYLGTPSHRNYEASTGDTWVIQKSNYKYILTISYSKDTAAKSYSIQYKFSNTLFHKTGKIVVSQNR